MLRRAVRQHRSSIPIRIAVLGSLIAAASITVRPAASADLWVDRNSNGGPCDDSRARAVVTAATPWCTLIPAGESVLPGDVVHVRAGEYTEVNTCDGCGWTAILDVAVTGTAQAPIRFTAMPGESVVFTPTGGAIRAIEVARRNELTPRFIEVDGFEVRGAFTDACVLVNNTSDVTISNLEVSGCVFSAVSVLQPNRITIEGCRVHDNPMGGWTSSVSLFECLDGNVVRGNYIWENTDENPDESEGHGIILDSCGTESGVLIENNVIWHNEGWCINVLYSDGATIRNNVCWRNSLGRFDGSGELSLRGVRARVHNNIFVSRSPGPALQIYGDAGDISTVFSDHNILWSPDHTKVVGWPTYQFGTVAEYQQQNPRGLGGAILAA